MLLFNMKTMASMVVISSFLLTHNAWAGKTTLPLSEECSQEHEQVSTLQRRSSTLAFDPQRLQEIGLLIIGASLLPLTEAQNSDPQTIGTNFSTTVLPSILGGYCVFILKPDINTG